MISWSPPSARACTAHSKHASHSREHGSTDATKDGVDILPFVAAGSGKSIGNIYLLLRQHHHGECLDLLPNHKAERFASDAEKHEWWRKRNGVEGTDGRGNVNAGYARR